MCFERHNLTQLNVKKWNPPFLGVAGVASSPNLLQYTLKRPSNEAHFPDVASIDPTLCLLYTVLHVFYNRLKYSFNKQKINVPKTMLNVSFQIKRDLFAQLSVCSRELGGFSSIIYTGCHKITAFFQSLLRIADDNTELQKSNRDCCRKA